MHLFLSLIRKNDHLQPNELHISVLVELLATIEINFLKISLLGLNIQLGAF